MRTFGDLTPKPERLEKTARLRLFTESFELKWSHCSATADFLSEYYAAIFAPVCDPREVADVRHSIAYLTNELVENAVKFRTRGDVEIEAGIDNGSFLLHIANWIAPEAGQKLETLLPEITNGEPGDLLIQRIEANAEGGSGSGL